MYLKNSVKAQSPGRINIIGEHTDYNDGFVLPAAIDKKITVEVSRNNSRFSGRLFAKNLNKSHVFNLNNLKPVAEGWPNYILGVVDQFQKAGAKLSGFDLSFGGDIPMGSGLSSSAALECSVAFALNELFHLNYNKIQIIKFCQMAEHEFAGTKCGIMDQFASVMGKKDQVFLLDCRTLEYKYFPFDLGQYQIVLLNSNVSHSLADSEYNTRRAACEEGVFILKKHIFNIKNLRDVSLEQLIRHKDKFTEKIYKRCYHVLSENERVLSATEAMTGKQFQTLGQLLNASHRSLSEDYEVSCKELDYIQQKSIELPYVLGSRMMGGGFGGCTISIVEKNKAEEFIDLIYSNYKKDLGLELSPVRVSIEDGAMVF